MARNFQCLSGPGDSYLLSLRRPFGAVFSLISISLTLPCSIPLTTDHWHGRVWHQPHFYFGHHSSKVGCRQEVLAPLVLKSSRIAFLSGTKAHVNDLLTCLLTLKISYGTEVCKVTTKPALTDPKIMNRLRGSNESEK